VSFSPSTRASKKSRRTGSSSPQALSGSWSRTAVRVVCLPSTARYQQCTREEEERSRTLTAPTHSAFSPCVSVRHSLRVSSLLHFCCCGCDCGSLRLCASESWAPTRTVSTQRSRIERLAAIIIQLGSEQRTTNNEQARSRNQGRDIRGAFHYRGLYKELG
jgi:hypothetical protein